MFPGLARETIRLALLEDLGHGDITSLAVVTEGRDVQASMLAKEDLSSQGCLLSKRFFR